jgi:hypothetical protein
MRTRIGYVGDVLTDAIVVHQPHRFAKEIARSIEACSAIVAVDDRS